MRRSIMVAASAIALVGALAVGPFGAAAAAPYVYGCTPATFPSTMSAYFVSLSIYNGSASTANLTHKILTGNGTIWNGMGLPVTSTLPATRTSVHQWQTGTGTPSQTNRTLPASVRIVSNVPVFPTLSHHEKTSSGSSEWKPIVCALRQP